MKIETNTTVVKTSIDAEAVSLGIDLSGMNHVMSILSNLYSNAPLAVLREYSTNARDAHIQAGNSAPIQVTSPTDILPQLTIQDFGVGMSSDDIKDVYTKYGSSTKRDSNDQVGAFGIGSKSAFTISSQFTVTGVKAGVRTIVLFSLTEDNTPIYQVLSKEFTDEPNGVKVSIPISDVTQMNATIRKFFYTWRTGSVLVDGVQPENVWTDSKAIPLGQDIYLRVADPHTALWERRTTVQMVMGGIAYPVETQITRKFPKVHKGATVYIEVPIGSVDIAPSREALKDTVRTVALVEASIETFAEAMKMSEAADIGLHANNPVKAVWEMRRWGELLGSETWETQERKWDLQRLAPTEDETDPQTGIIRKVPSGASMIIAFDKNGTKLAPHMIRHFMVVTGCDTPAKVRLVLNRRDKWRKEYGTQYGKDEGIILIPAFGERGRIGWFAFGTGEKGAVSTIAYKQFKGEAAVLYRPAYSTNSQAPVVYSCKIGQDAVTTMYLDQITEALENRTAVFLNEWRTWLGFLDDGYVQVRCTGKQKYEAMEKRFNGFPTAEYQKLLDQEYQRKLDALSAYDKESVAMNAAVTSIPRDARTILLKLDAKNVNDPEVRSILEKLEHVNTIQRDDLEVVVAKLDKDMREAADKVVANILKHYPLLRILDIPHWSDSTVKSYVDPLLTYLNAC